MTTVNMDNSDIQVTVIDILYIVNMLTVCRLG